MVLEKSSAIAANSCPQHCEVKLKSWHEKFDGEWLFVLGSCVVLVSKCQLSSFTRPPCQSQL